MNKGCLIALAVIFGILSIGLGYYFYQQSKKDPVVYEVEKPSISNIINKTVATGLLKVPELVSLPVKLT